MALGIGAFWSRRLRPLCVGIILAGMVAVFLNWDNLSTEDRDKGGLGTMNTIHYRINLIYEAVDIFVENPLFGCGFMNFSEVALQYRRPRDVPFFGYIDIGVGGEAVLHNIFVTIFAEQGLSGLIPYLLVYFFVWRASVRAYREMPREGLISRDWVVCSWCAMAGYMVNGMFIEVRYFEYINVLFFFLMGTMVGMHERHLAGLTEVEEVDPSAGRPRGVPWPEEIGSGGVS